MTENTEMQDGQTWVPTVMLRFVEPLTARVGPVLCQLWVNVLGETQWREVEMRHYDSLLGTVDDVLKSDVKRPYKPCDVFGLPEETEDA